MPSLRPYDGYNELGLNGEGLSSALENFHKVVATGLLELEASLLGEPTPTLPLELLKEIGKRRIVDLDAFSNGHDGSVFHNTIKPVEAETLVDLEKKRQFQDREMSLSQSEERGRQMSGISLSQSWASEDPSRSPGGPTILNPAEANWQDLVVGLLDVASSFIKFTVHPAWEEAEDPTRTVSFSMMSPTQQAWHSRTTRTTRSGVSQRQVSNSNDVNLAIMERDVDRLKKRLQHLERKAYLNTVNSSLMGGDAFCRRPRLIAHPYSPRRFIWSCFSLLLIILDFIVVTMMPFVAVGTTTTTQVVSDWAIALFWTMDVVLNFTTGFFHQGRLEMDFRAIALHYVRRWFAFDFFLVVLSWLVVALARANIRRVVVAMRLGRLLRVISLKGLLSSKVSDSIRKPFRRALFVICLLVFVHVCACLWYYVGDSENGWVSTQSPRENEEGGYAYHGYLLSVRWAVAQLQGNMELEIQYTVNETILEIVVNFVAILVMATFVSSLTNALAILIKHRKESKGTKRAIWAYLRRHNISSELSEKVKNYVVKQMQDQARQSFKEGRNKEKIALDFLPIQLRNQLKTEARARTLDWHPIFAFLRMSDMRMLEKVCCDAIDQENFQENDNVFFTGDRCLNAYWVVAGSFALVNMFPIAATVIGNEVCSSLMQNEFGGGKRISEASVSSGSSWSESESSVSPATQAMARASNNEDPVTVQQGSVVSEASLWMVCQHYSNLSCSARGVLHVVNSQKFIKFIRSDLIILAPIAWYANRFVRAATIAVHHTDTGFVPELFNFRSVLDEVRRDGDRDVPLFTSGPERRRSPSRPPTHSSRS